MSTKSILPLSVALEKFYIAKLRLTYSEYKIIITKLLKLSRLCNIIY
jgi:hypothetical protein